MKRPAYDRNLIVLGAGSAGLVTSYLAAALQARVTLIEKHRMGGDCLNTGCVPSKALLRTARLLADIRSARRYGLRSATADYDFAEVMERVQAVVRQVAPHDSVARYTGLGVEVIEAEGYILDPHTVRVGDRRLTARHIVVATGARPAIPVIPGLQAADFVTSDSVWALRERPRRLLVIGGGPIGCELAQAFRRLGCEVSLLQRRAHLLPHEDPDVSVLLRAVLEEEGVRVLTGVHQESIHDGRDARELHCISDAGKAVLTFDRLLIAAGRVANTQGFGLEELGVRIRDHQALVVDGFLASDVPSIYACGDVVGPYQFTHAAAHQAWYAAVNTLFNGIKRSRADYSVMPWCTFTDPEIARVGLNETQAGALNIPYEVTRFEMHELDRAIADGATAGFVKVLTRPRSDRILGVTLAGQHAGELLAEFVLAMRHGLGLNKILGTIHVYPTMTEANKSAAGAWRRAHTPAWLLPWLRGFHAWRRGCG